MIVKELRKLLQNIPQSLEVRIEYPDGNGSFDNCKAHSLDYNKSACFISFDNNSEV